MQQLRDRHTSTMDPSMMRLFFLALQKLLTERTALTSWRWCQAGIGSCVGERHNFRMTPIKMGSLVSQDFDETLRFADWDGDGSTDILLGDGGSIFFFPHDYGEYSSKRFELVTLRAREGQLQSRFEVVDWDGSPDFVSAPPPATAPTPISSSPPLMVSLQALSLSLSVMADLVRSLARG
eukprot:s2249_g11.t1